MCAHKLSQIFFKCWKLYIRQENIKGSQGVAGSVPLLQPKACKWKGTPTHCPALVWFFWRLEVIIKRRAMTSSHALSYLFIFFNCQRVCSRERERGSMPDRVWSCRNLFSSISQCHQDLATRHVLPGAGAWTQTMATCVGSSFQCTGLNPWAMGPVLRLHFLEYTVMNLEIGLNWGKGSKS